MLAVSPPEPPLFLLPGMGADDRLFRPQLDAFPNAVVPPWLPPLPSESLADYARRFAEAIDPGRPCFVGGASFGGFVALEMAAHLKALGCFLIGSARGPSGMPARVRCLRPFARMIGAFPIGILKPVAWSAHQSVARFAHPRTRSFLRQLPQPDGQFLRWGMRVALTWRPTPAAAGVRVFQIHGERDWILPASRSGADVVLPGAGHLLSLTHAADVTDFLRRHMMAAACPTSA